MVNPFLVTIFYCHLALVLEIIPYSLSLLEFSHLETNVLGCGTCKTSSWYTLHLWDSLTATHS